jgi:hypothetical protein
MSESNSRHPGQTGAEEPEQTLKDIRQMMERSSRFISLSGLSGIAAGICALAGAWLARNMLESYGADLNAVPVYPAAMLEDSMTLKLLGLAAGTLCLAFISAFFLTWRKARKSNLPVWDHTSRRLIWNVFLPVMAGGLFILGMLRLGEWRFVAPACLLFYGLALINGSKYTLTDIRYLGYLEIILGLINIWYPGQGLLFWTIGFGFLHIIYGSIMWWKYERNGDKQ